MTRLQAHDSTEEKGDVADSSWTMELSRWRVRLRRLKRWSRYEGRASDGQFDTSDVPESERIRSTAPPVPERHSLTSVDRLRTRSNDFELVVPPVRVPSAYRQQDRQRGVRVGGDRVPFTFDGHMRRRKLIRALTSIEEQKPLDALTVPDMRNSMTAIYTWQGSGRTRRACSV